MFSPDRCLVRRLRSSRVSSFRLLKADDSEHTEYLHPSLVLCIQKPNARSKLRRALTCLTAHPKMARRLDPSAMIGQTLGHYRIIEKVASGGMGVVYRAHDDQLERDVALKVLPAGTLSDDATRRQFRKEALALAKLSHPNIETVYEFDTQDGMDFLVMEYLPGKTLAETLTSGALPEKEVVAIGMQITAAMEEAHERGIVHRDLKPRNIAITARGQAKVLDFGLAKLLHQVSEVTSDTASDTQAGAGTLPYMPPEQLQGESVDARADIYTIGAVLYEMATNFKAFRQEVPSRLIEAILHQPPVPPRALNSRISLELEQVILKCLDKDPARRYQSAKELQVDLRRLDAPSSPRPVPLQQPSPVKRNKGAKPASYAAVAFLAVAIVLAGLNFHGWRDRLLGNPPAPQIRSLAVLPLENLSHDPEQEYFADGMTDELITELAKISGLKVISRTSVMRYKNAYRPPLPEMAKSLNVDGVVEGSVQRVGKRVKISARLIQARTDHEVWARSYERDFSDVLGLQHEVAEAVAGSIELTLEPANSPKNLHSVDPAAHEAYLRGLYYWNKRTPEGLKKAMEYFQQAIDEDPNYALAYAALSDSYHDLPELTTVPVSEAFPKARTAALKALELDSSLAEAHSALASVKEDYDWDWKGAEADYKRAIELSPGYMLAHANYSNLLLELGRLPEALAQARTAQQLDPLSVFANDNLAAILYYSGQYNESIDQCRKTLELDPTSSQAHRHLGQIYTQEGLYAEAVIELKKSIELSNGSAEGLAELGYVFGISGDTDKAHGILLQLKSRADVSPYHLAIVYMGLREKDKALEALSEAVTRRSAGVVHLKIARQFQDLHTDVRFDKMVTDVGLDINAGSGNSS
jgi:eukaryotic-like serine/threonine-protein kinase